MGEQDRNVAETLQALRRLDEQLVALLNERARLSQELGQSRRTLAGTGTDSLARSHDPAAEAALLEHALAANRNQRLRDSELREIYQRILAVCRHHEAGKTLTVACLGPVATQTHLAVLERFGTTIHCRLEERPEDVLRQVLIGQADYGMVAIENSLQGPVYETLDLLPGTPLRIYAEYTRPIEHCLVARPDSGPIVKIYSHPQVLGQCRHTLRNWEEEHHVRLVLEAVSSTSEGARRAREEPGAAALATRLAAETWGLTVLEEHMEDEPELNQTRFWVLGRAEMGTPPPTGRDKTTIWFQVRNEAGALYAALQPLRDHSISMSSILSRPIRRQPWVYGFFVDFDGHTDQPEVRETLQEVRRHCLELEVLGSYPVEA
jgi:chorismate mutase/prephenate dehydratase